MTDSWWLKFKRAQRHMVDLRREVWRYANSHPYRFLPIGQPNRYQGVTRYKFEIIHQPDPMMAAILGDFVHNLRSALDHIVVAVTQPRSKRCDAGFPISFDDLLATDADGQYIIHDAVRRESFTRAIDGVPPLVKAFIISSQPYNRTDLLADEHVLNLLSRMENADKHRELITIGSDLMWPAVTVTTADNQVIPVVTDYPPGQFVPGGTEVQVNLPVPHPEVKMEFSGTATVSIKVAHPSRNQQLNQFRLLETMAITLRNVRRLLRGIEVRAGSS